MRVCFVGFGKIAASALYAIASNSNYEITAVIYHHKKDPSHISEAGKRHKIQVHSVNSEKDILKICKDEKAELIIVSSYPYIFRGKILEEYKGKIVNIHCSALPRLKGVHPLNWAIIRDHKEIGVTSHLIDAGMDSGSILYQKKFFLEDFDNINTVIDKCANIAGEVLIEGLKNLEKGLVREQDRSNETYAPKRKEQDGLINWNCRTRDIFNLIRSLHDPYPNAHFYLKGKKVKVKQCKVSKTPGKILAIINNQYLITTSDGVILVCIESDDDLKVGDVLNNEKL